MTKGKHENTEFFWGKPKRGKSIYHPVTQRGKAQKRREAQEGGG